MYDLIIVGSGPSGLAAALSAKHLKLTYLVLERGDIANTIRSYPLGKELFSTSDEVELEKGALPTATKPTREEVLSHYHELVEKEGLPARTYEEVRSIKPAAGGFAVATRSGEYRSRAVLVAVGGFGRPRRLQVPGEEAGRVSYRFERAEPFAGKRILVVGGGNSAAQAALYLAEVGASVAWSLRRASLDAADQDTGQPKVKIKPWVREPLEREVAAGKIEVLFSSRVVAIDRQAATLRNSASEQTIEVPCDHIFALLGADPDTTLLEQAGAEMAPDGRPVYNTETYETTVAGLYVAGHVTRELHMKNALEVTPRIVERMAARLTQAVAR
jgi:thioredoxin reductase (NADPH)